jgi:putative hydrolase of the HAD superfamily
VSKGPEQGSSDIQLVVFDLGRVLVRICRDWQHACECAGFDWSAVDSGRRLALREVLHRAEVGEIGAEAFYAEASALLGCEPGKIRTISDAFIFGAYPSAAGLLGELTAAGVKTACLSNTNEHHWSLLFEPGHRAWLPMDRFDHHFASHLLRARKPDEAVYAHVERELAVDGSAILFFDDVMENIAAACSRRWIAHWIDPSPDDPVPQIRAALRRHRVLE